MITKTKAINSLVNDCVFSVTKDGDVVWIIPSNPPVTDAQINAELTRLQAEYEAKEYQRARAATYPSFADQFDLLYHGGLDAWKEAIDAVKTEFPKP